MILKVFLFVFVVLSKEIVYAKTNNTESRLLETLFDGYDHEVRPIKNSSQPISLRMGLNLKQIISVDFMHQILTLQVWIKLFWKDEYLIWNPDDYDGIDMMTVSPSKLWKPEIALYNAGSRESDSTGHSLKAPFSLWVNYNGEVTWSSPAIVSSECKVDVSHFPFDSQNCYLEFGLWSNHARQIDLDINKPYVDTETFSPDDEWLLRGSKAWRELRKYSCCEDAFPSVIFSISLKRRAMFYFLNLIVPCGLLTIVSLFSFILPPNSGERVSFVITVLLSLSVYMMIVTNIMPHSSQTPLASQFFLFVMCMQSLSLVMTCFVIRFHNNRDPLPKWFDFVVNKLLARLLCMDCCNRRKTKSELSHIEHNFDKHAIYTNNNFVNDDDKIAHPRESRDSRESNENKINALHEETSSPSVNHENNYTKLIEEVRVLSDKIRVMNSREKLQDKWKFATRVLDRFFLVSLLVSVFVVFFMIFMTIPDDSILT